MKELKQIFGFYGQKKSGHGCYLRFRFEQRNSFVNEQVGFAVTSYP